MGAQKLRIGLPVVVAAACLLGLAVPPASATYVPPWRAAEVLSPAGGGYAQLVAVACPGARTCEATGSYSPGKSGTRLAMVAAEVKGHWSRAVRVRLPVNAAAAIEDSTLASVSCPSARSCVAVGYYTFGTNIEQGIIATGHGTTWARARVASLPANRLASQDAYLTGVSCPKTGDCAAVGGYTTKAGVEPMVQTMTRGRWRRAIAIRLPANAAADPAAHLTSVSCTAVGRCVAVGGYNDKALDAQAMAAYETKGHWGRAVRVPLPASAAVQSLALLTAVSCVHTVYCAAAGTYFTKTDTQGAYVQTETRGRWHAAVRITALPAGAQTSGPAVLLTGLSCLTSGCLAAGAYQDKASALVQMTVLGSGRTWGRGVPVRLPHGAAAGAAQTAELSGVTCYPVGIDCTGAGEYTATGSPDISEAMTAVGGR
jgi:hypothetical protein